MAFRLPSVIVYQELVSTNVSTVTPFMDLCVVGPLYQVNDGANCKNYAQFEDGDTYSSEYPDLTLGAEIDTDSVEITASDVYVKVWPTVTARNIVGKVKLENYEREIDETGKYKVDADSGNYIYMTTTDVDDDGSDIEVKIPADTTTVYCDYTQSFEAANIAVGDFVEVTYKYLTDTDAVDGSGQYTEDAYTYESISAKIVEMGADPNGDYALTLNKVIPDHSGDATYVSATAVVFRKSASEVIIDSDYVTAGAENFEIGWVTRINRNADGQIVSRLAEPPSVVIPEADDPLPLYAATIDVSYRALRQDLVNDFSTITSYANAEATLGKVHIKNPLSIAASVINSAIGGLTYRVLPIESDDAHGYSKALDILANNEKVYCIVPLTDDKDIIAAYASHCKSMSMPEKSKWRIMYASMPMPVTKVVIELNAGRLTYFTDDEVFIKDVANGVFATNGCRPTDFVDVYDASNKYMYSLQLLKVINESTAKFSRVLWTRTTEGYQQQIDDFGDPVKMPLENASCKPKSSCQVNVTYKVRDINYEVVRVLDTQGITESICGIAKSFKNKRLRYVMPDTIMVNVNEVMEPLSGEYLCVALGAMRCGLPPHQGFSTIGISGISRVLNANKMFTEDQLTEMAAAGVFWVAQDEPEELPYVLYQTTTDNTQLETSEDSIVATVDYASKYYKDNLKNVLGRYNVNSISLNYVKTVINACSDDMLTTSYEYIGPILTSAALTDLRAEADHIYPTIKIGVPYPVNGVDVTLQV